MRLKSHSALCNAMINDTLNNEVTCILEKRIIFLTRVTVIYMADSLNSINGIESVPMREKGS